ncbi:MAG: hypothetical protein U0792_09745 [Gemmataceae bacterium]
MSDTILAIDLGRHKRVYDCCRRQPTSPTLGVPAQARGMAFRVLIIGGKQRVEYPRLRDALDVLIAKRLPDVELLTAGGPGVPAQAAFTPWATVFSPG